MIAESIKELYEVENLSISAIAEALGLDETSIKTALASHSAAFREACKADAGLFNADAQAEAVRVIEQIMTYGEVEAVRMRAAKFIIDERKGRNDIVKGANTVNINVNMFNEQMKRARNSLSKTKLLGNTLDAQVA